jgi:hypothetical protein
VYVSRKLVRSQLRARAPEGHQGLDLLVERPTRFGRIINLRMAKTIGLTVSRPLLLRADEVIQ